MPSVSQPITPADFEKYYHLRYEILRKPWHQPVGSERDADEDSSIHAFIKENDLVIGVARLQFVDDNTAQVRFMAVDPSYEGRGFGKKLLEFLEEKSKEAGRNTVVLHAREKAVKFYERCGYRIVQKSHLLWGQIQHWLMQKDL